MSSETREDQWAELEALRSVYDESHVTFVDGICISGRVVVEMEPLTKPIAVFVTTEKGRKSVVLTIFPPVVLMFSLPPIYPSVPPDLELECEWMDKVLISTIHIKLDEVCQEHLGMGVLFFCCETVIEIVRSHLSDLSELCIDDTPYGIINNMKGTDLLRRVADSSSRSADFRFQSGCYDCEVCFENKAGKECLLFRPCQHVFCKECVTCFFFEILNNQEIRPLGCLADGCDSSASQKIIQSVIGETEFERYEKLLLEKALAVMNDVVLCPRKICQNPVVISEGTHNLGSCGICGYSFCVLCRRGYHGIDRCNFKSADKQRLVMEWDSADEKERAEMGRRFGGLKNLQMVIDTVLNDGWIDKNSKPCPRCRVRIEKNGGCNKMHCSKCNIMFCWLCHCVLDASNPYLHFKSDTNCVNRLFEGLTEYDIEIEDDDDDDDLDIEYEYGSLSSVDETGSDNDFEIPLGIRPNDIEALN